jgi:autotransporter-associated beta strand protein
LTKTQAGGVTLGGANTYTGATSVMGGKLWVNNTHTGGGSYSVSAGATLGGTGSIGSAVTTTANISPGAATNTIGTLTVASATFSGASSSFTVDIGSGANNADKLTSSGAITLNGTISFNPLSAPNQPVYTLVSASPLNGTFAAVTGLPSGYVLDYSTPGEVRLTQIGGDNDGTWISTSSGLWDGAGNWQLSSIASGSGKTANFGTLDITADVTVSLDSPRTIGSMIFGDTALGTPANWFLDNNGDGENILTLDGASPTITVNAMGSAKSAIVGAEIAGTDGLTKSGTGTLVLLGDNSFTGGTTIGAGTLQVGSASTTGTLPGDVVNNGVLVFSRSDDYTQSGTISGIGSIRQSGAGALTLSSANSFTGGVRLISGTLVLGHKNAAGTGPLTLEAGTLQASTDLSGVNALANAWSLAANSTVTGAHNITIGGPYTGATGTRTINCGLDSGKLLTISSDMGLSADATGRTLALAGAGAVTISGDISNGGTATDSAINKNGAGTLILSGDNTYGGTTVINLGAVLVNGAHTGGGAYTAVAGSTLGGSGSIGSTGTVYGTLSPGAAADTVGTLSMAQVTFSGGSTAFAVDIGSGANNADKLLSSGAVTVSGTISLNQIGTPDQASYTLISAASLSGTFGTVVGLPSGYYLDYTIPGQLRLVAEGDGIWTSTSSGTWSTSGKWLNGTVPSGAGKTANFGTLNIVNDVTVSLDTARTIGKLIFGDANPSSAANWVLDNNSTLANTLTISDSAPVITVNALGTDKSATISAVIAGTSGFTKDGAGQLTLSGTNTYSGKTIISNGTVSIAAETGLGANPASSWEDALTLNGGALGATANVTIDDAYRGITVGAAGGAFTPTANATVTVAKVIAGPGKLEKSGAGSVTLNNANTFGGGLWVRSGEVLLDNNAAAGPSAVPVLLGDPAGGSALLRITGFPRYLTNDVCLATNATGSWVLEVAGTAGGYIEGDVALNGSDVRLRRTGSTNPGNFMGAITGSGDIVLENFSSNAGLVLYSGIVNSMGMIIVENGTSSDSTAIRSYIGPNVTGIEVRGAGSRLLLNSTNEFTGGITVKSGTLTTENGSPGSTVTSGSFGNPNWPIILGDPAGNGGPSTLLGNGTSYSNAIVLAAGTTGLVTIGNALTTQSPYFDGPVTLNGNTLKIAKTGTSGSVFLRGGVSGVGNLYIEHDVSSSGSVNITGPNITGWILNTNRNAATTPTLTDLGPSITHIVQNGPNSVLSFSGTSSSTATVEVINGNIQPVASGLSFYNNVILGAGTKIVIDPNNNATNGGLSGYGTVESSGASTRTYGMGPLSGQHTFNGAINNGPGIVNVFKTGGGTQVLAGANGYTGVTMIENGVLALSGSGTLGAGTGGVTLSGGSLNLGGLSRTAGAVSITAAAASGATITNGTLTATSYSASLTNGNAIVSATLAGADAAMSKTGAGTLTLAANSTYGGGSTLSAGTVNINNNGALGTNTVTFQGGYIDNTSGGTITLSMPSYTQSGTLTYVGSLGATLDLGTGALSLNNANRVYDISAGTLIIGGVISHGGTVRSITKSGAGTLVLNGNNAYNSQTLINQGTLVLNGTHTGGAQMSLAQGATLAGTGTIPTTSGILEGVVAPGATVGSIGQFNISGPVTWLGAAYGSAATDWKFDLGSSSASDLLNIAGNFARDNTTHGSVFRFDFGNSTQVGTFTLVQWTGTTGFTVNDFSYVNLPDGRSVAFELNTGTSPRTLKVTISTCNNPPTISLGTSPSACQSGSSQSVNLPVAATTQSPDRYTIDFDSTANAAGFSDVGLTVMPSIPGNVSLTVPANAPVGTYTGLIYAVRNSDGCRGSASFTVTVNGPPAVPGAITQSNPSGNSVCAASSGVIYSIAPVAGATSYTWTEPAGTTILSGQGTSSITLDWGVAGVGGAVLKVKANGACGSSADRSDNFTVLSGAPGAPTADAASEISLTSFMANWSEGSGTVAGYRLDVASTIDFSSGYVVSNATVSDTSYLLSGLESGVTYYYRVRAYNSCGSSPDSETITVLTPQILAGWDVSPLTGGLGNYGASPLPPSTHATGQVTVVGLTRGSGVSQIGNATTRGWGGTGWNGASAGAAATAGQYATAVVSPVTGRLVSYMSINKLDYRRASTGPGSGVLQYSMDGATYTDITNLDYSVTAISGGSIAMPIDLSAISALQSVGSGTQVTFRIVNHGAQSETGPWYIYDKENTTDHDFEIRGVICETPIAYGVSGGGSYCSADAGATVGLSNSQPRVTYRLYRDGNVLMATRSGAGSAISFGPQAAAGTYTVVATRNSGGCAANMTGSAVVSVIQTPGAPTNVIASATLDEKTKLDWTAPGGTVPTGYNVKRSTQAEGTYTTIGANVQATTYTVPSGIAGVTYYYKVTALNGSCESESSVYVEAVWPGDCPDSEAPVIANPGNKTVAVNLSLSHVVTAQESSPLCTSPTLTYSPLPAWMTPVVNPSGNSVTLTLGGTPTDGQQGSYPITVTATDAQNLSTSCTFVVYVGNISESGYNGGSSPPPSQTNWHVAITSLLLSSSGNATVVWTSVDGVQYDVYSSALPIGGGASWSKEVNAQEAQGTLATAAVPDAVSGGMRFYQVVPQGGARSDLGVWGVIRPTIPAGFSMFSQPLDLDRKFNGQFGTNLAAALPANTLIYIMHAGPNPTWTTLRLNGGKWVIDGGSTEYTTPLNPGQGFFINNPGPSAAIPEISGPVGNDGTSLNTLAVGFNIVGLSEGKAQGAGTAFSDTSMNPVPVASYNDETADQVVLLDTNGTWRRLIRRPTGVWYDATTRTTATLNLNPGQAYYYIRRESPSTVSF